VSRAEEEKQTARGESVSPTPPSGPVFEGHFFCRASLDMSRVGIPDLEIRRLHAMAPILRAREKEAHRKWLEELNKVSDDEDETSPARRKPKYREEDDDEDVQILE
jgi:hypothetical protein